MKRSRMFLGMTTAVLAVAGVVAVKAAKVGPNHTAYYITSGGKCTAFQTPCVKLASGILTCRTSGGSATVYTQRTAGPNQTCKTKLIYTNL